jgi:dienelactone hydrolase
MAATTQDGAATTTEPVADAAAAGAMDCCVTGYLDVGETRGTDGTLGGFPAYFARPAIPTTKALMICTDVFGYNLINIRLLADTVCRETGLLVVVPDLFDGDALPVSLMDMVEAKADGWWGAAVKGVRMVGTLVGTLLPWMLRHGDNAIRPKLEPIVRDLRAAHGIERVAAQGFCWGGRYSILLASTDLVDVGVHNHPSRVGFPADVEGISKPSFFVFAEVCCPSHAHTAVAHALSLCSMYA